MKKLLLILSFSIFGCSTQKHGYVFEKGSSGIYQDINFGDYDSSYDSLTWCVCPNGWNDTLNDKVDWDSLIDLRIGDTYTDSDVDTSKWQVTVYDTFPDSIRFHTPHYSINDYGGKWEYVDSIKTDTGTIYFSKGKGCGDFGCGWHDWHSLKNSGVVHLDSNLTGY